MQHSSVGVRGDILIAHNYIQNHRNNNIDDDDDDDDNTYLSNSNSDEKDDDHNDINRPSAYSSVGMQSDFELAIRNLRPSVTRRKKVKPNLNISKQKADLPQLNITNDETQNNLNEEKKNENNLQDKQSRQWFPKPDVGHVDSDDFIRHNHVGKFISSKYKNKR